MFTIFLPPKNNCRIKRKSKNKKLKKKYTTDSIKVVCIQNIILSFPSKKIGLSLENIFLCSFHIYLFILKRVHGVCTALLTVFNTFDQLVITYNSQRPGAIASDLTFPQSDIISS